MSRADKRRGRGGALVPSPVKAAALDLGLAVTDRVEDVVGSGAELGVVVAFGRIIKPDVLAVVPMINLHFSLLPRWRGAAPVERAILSGDEETGVCLMAVEEGLDTGPVYACERVAIGADETAEQLRSRLVAIGTDLLVAELGRGLGTAVAQAGAVSYAAKVEPDELRVDWTAPAVQVARVVRVGRAWTTWRGRRLLVRRGRVGAGRGLPPGVVEGTSVGTGDGSFELVEVQPEGRGPMAAAGWRNGAHLRPGESLGS